MNSSDRFIIYGAGAIGSVFGGMLAKAGHQVSLIGRDPHMEAVRENGLLMEGLLGSHQVMNLEAFTDITRIVRKPSVTALFISVKSSDTSDAVREVAQSGLVEENTLVVSLQNGLGNLEQIRDTFGPLRSFGGRVIFGASVPEPGRVHVSVWADKVLIGGPDMEPGKLCGRRLAALLTACGIETEAVDNIQAALWGKVLYNIGLNPLSALLNVPYGNLGRQQNARSMLISLMKEAFTVAFREVDLQWGSADEYLEFFFQKLLPPTEAHHSSMLQDINRGRETEIDAITGQVIKKAEAMNISVPVNRVVYELVKAKVATARRP